MEENSIKNIENSIKNIENNVNDILAMYFDLELTKAEYKKLRYIIRNYMEVNCILRINIIKIAKEKYYPTGLKEEASMT